MNQKTKTMLGVFVATVVILYFLSIFELFGQWDSTLYYLGVIIFYFIGYFIFEYFQNNIKFNFAEAYIGIILLVILYFGFWLGFRIYYGNLASLNNISYTDFYANSGLNMFKYLITCPYIYLSLSFFGGWIGFCINYFRKKVKKNE
jgi:hypothetical protein